MMDLEKFTSPDQAHIDRNWDPELPMEGPEGAHRRDFIILLSVVVLLGLACIGLVLGGLSASTKAAGDAYEAARAEADEAAYQAIYDKSFDVAERKHHVSNRVSIEIESLREEAKLEVLKVSDVEYVIEEKENDGIPVLSWVRDQIDGVSFWVEVPGDGVFTVDLQLAEFLVDDERQSVLIRVPQPELSEFRIDYGNIKVLNVKDGKLSNAGAGEERIRQQLKDADEKLREGIASNERAWEAAKSSTRNILTNLVRELNPGAFDLSVEVEFMGAD